MQPSFRFVSWRARCSTSTLGDARTPRSFPVSFPTPGCLSPRRSHSHAEQNADEQPTERREALISFLARLRAHQISGSRDFYLILSDTAPSSSSAPPLRHSPLSSPPVLKRSLPTFPHASPFLPRHRPHFVTIPSDAEIQPTRVCLRSGLNVTIFREDQERGVNSSMTVAPREACGRQ